MIRPTDLRSVLFCPILIKDQVGALLEFFAPPVPVFFNTDLVDFLTQVATLLAVVAEAMADKAELRKLALFAQESSSILIVTDRNERIEWVNPGFTAVTGYLLEEVIGKNPVICCKGRNPIQRSSSGCGQPCMWRTRSKRS